jgi:hypothetical protein
MAKIDERAKAQAAWIASEPGESFGGGGSGAPSYDLYASGATFYAPAIFNRAQAEQLRDDLCEWYGPPAQKGAPHGQG